MSRFHAHSNCMISSAKNLNSGGKNVVFSARVQKYSKNATQILIFTRRWLDRNKSEPETSSQKIGEKVISFHLDPRKTMKVNMDKIMRKHIRRVQRKRTRKKSVEVRHLRQPTQRQWLRANSYTFRMVGKIKSISANPSDIMKMVMICNKLKVKLQL